MNPNKTVAISGSTGFIGSRLCTYFSSHGYKVIGLCRNIPIQPPAGVEYRYCSLEVMPNANLFKDVDVFIHLAYIKGENAEQVNIAGTKRLLKLAKESGVKKNIFFSSMAAHADALSAYGKQKLKLEQEFLGREDAVIKPGLVIGNGGLFAEMAHHIRTKGIIPLVNGGRQPLYTVHIDDLVKATEIIVRKNLSGTFTVAESTAVLYRHFYKAFSKALDKKVLMLSIPYGLMGALLSFTKMLGIKTGVGKENLLGLKALRTFEFSAELEKLGFTPRSYTSSLALFSEEIKKK